MDEAAFVTRLEVMNGILVDNKSCTEATIHLFAHSLRIPPVYPYSLFVSK